MTCADHPSGNRGEKVRIYYKESLPIKNLQGCVCFDLKIESKRRTIVLLNRSPSQSANEFENFLNNLNQTMESVTQKNPFLTIAVGDINAMLSKRQINCKKTQGLKTCSFSFSFHK